MIIGHQDHSLLSHISFISCVKSFTYIYLLTAPICISLLYTYFKFLFSPFLINASAPVSSNCRHPLEVNDQPGTQDAHGDYALIILTGKLTIAPNSSIFYLTNSFKINVDVSRTWTCPVTDTASFTSRALTVWAVNSLALLTGKHLFLTSVLLQG